MKKISAVILAGGEGSRLGVLTAKRTKPAVPFAGKYRIIDFCLSNCVNSGIHDLMIVTQYRPHSLLDHIGSGGPWDLDRELSGGVRIYSPYQSREDTGWFVGTADAVQQNFLFIKDRHPDLVLILSGDHIYRMNYRELIRTHLDSRAEATMATIEVPIEEASRFGIVGVEEGGRASSFVEKPAEPPSNLANMGIYIFDYETLDRVLLEDSETPGSSHDFGKDILPKMIADGRRVFTWPYKGYWRDVGTLASYWEAHMDLLGDPPAYDLNDLGWLIHTRSERRSPARVGKDVALGDSLIAHGCVIGSGATVSRSVLGPGVKVGTGAIVRDSVIMNDVVIGEGAIVERAIIDKRTIVGPKAKIGAANSKVVAALELTVLGKRCEIPGGFEVHAGAALGADVIASDLEGREAVEPGEVIQTARKPHEIPSDRW